MMGFICGAQSTGVVMVFCFWGSTVYGFHRGTLNWHSALASVRLKRSFLCFGSPPLNMLVWAHDGHSHRV